jgi:hypothetical protein
MFRTARARTVTATLAVIVASAASMLVAVPSANAVNAGDESDLRLAFADVNEIAINLTGDVTLTCAGGGALLRASDTAITITGNGHTLTQSCAGADIATQTNAGAITIDQLHLVAAADGISTAGDLTATDTTMTGGPNGMALELFPGHLELHRVVVTGFGKWAEVDGSGRIDHSSFRNARGGGLEFSGDGTVDIDYSSVTGAGGHGVVVDGGFLRLLNSTVAGNGGDGIATDRADITLVHSTVVGNTTSADPHNQANISSSSGHLTSSASVVALAVGHNDCSIEEAGFSHHSFSSDGSCNFDDPTDHSGGGDPRLGPLQDNGGLGLSLLPSPPSPLVDAVPPASCGDGEMVAHSDQRDGVRPVGPGCDIGALEIQTLVAETTTTTTTATPTTTTTTPPAQESTTTSTSTTTSSTTPPSPAPAQAPAAVAAAAAPAFTG